MYVYSSVIIEAHDIDTTNCIVEIRLPSRENPIDDMYHVQYSADSSLAPSQWETSLQSNAVSHWLGANLESAPQYKSRMEH